MKITLFLCVYPPEPVTSAVMGADLAEALAARGHVVSVYTGFPNRPGGIVHKGYLRIWRTTEKQNNVFVHRNWHFISRRSAYVSRFLENVTLGWTSIRAFLHNERANVVYSNTWPLFASWMVARACRGLGIPLVVHVKDLYPEALFPKTSRMPRFVKKYLLSLDETIVRYATKVITLSPGFNDHYRTIRGIPDEKLELVYDWRDPQEIVPMERNGAFRRMHHIPDETFVAMFAGNVGKAAGVSVLVQTAAQLRDSPDLLLLVVGGGTEGRAFQQLIEQERLTDVRYIREWPNEVVSEVHAAADVLLLTSAPNVALTSVPSKLISYMMAGRPILASIHKNSDSARIIRAADAGWSLPEGNAGALAKMILELKARQELLLKKDKNARRYAIHRFSRDNCLPRLISILEDCARRKGDNDGG